MFQTVTSDFKFAVRDVFDCKTHHAQSPSSNTWQSGSTELGAWSWQDAVRKVSQKSETISDQFANDSVICRVNLVIFLSFWIPDEWTCHWKQSCCESWNPLASHDHRVMMDPCMTLHGQAPEQKAVAGRGKTLWFVFHLMIYSQFNFYRKSFFTGTTSGRVSVKENVCSSLVLTASLLNL